MDASLTSSRWLRVLVGFGSIVVITAALYFAQEVLIPVILGVLLTFVLSPLVTALQRLHMPRPVAVLLVVAFAFAVLGGIGTLVYSQVQNLAVELPKKKPEIVRKVRGLLESGRGTWLDEIVTTWTDINKEVKQANEGTPAKGPHVEPVPVVAVANNGPGYLLEVASPALKVLLQGALTVVLLIFMLLRREDLRNRLIRLSGEGSITNMTKALDDGANRLSRFLLAQLCINAGFGALAAAGLWLIGVPYAIVWGLLAGALRYLPYIGAYVGGALALVAAAFLVPEAAGWTPAVLTLVLFVGMELITANLIEPWLFGHSIGVSEVALLVAAAFWGWLWGPIGLVLSAPLTACLAVLGKYVPQLEVFDVLLGDEPVLKDYIRYYQRLLARDEDEASRLVEDYRKEHCGDEVFDNIFLPALLLTKSNRDRGRLTDEDVQFILQATRDLLEDMPVATEEARRKQECASEATRRWDAAPPAGVLVLGCPARDGADALALEMLHKMLDPDRCRLDNLSPNTLASEVLLRVERDGPAAVCLATLPPHGLSYTRYLCKRLRAKFPRLEVVVLSLGRQDEAERVAARLRESGASHVASSLAECRDLLLPVVQLFGHKDEGRELAAPAPA